MTDKELKREKEELLAYLHEKISKVKNESKLRKILEKVNVLNQFLDKNDSSLQNLLDNLSQGFSSTIQIKIKRKLNDIFDKYDKKDRRGEPIYSNEDRIKIQNLIKEINDICDENFWDRFKIVLGIGT